MSDLTITINPPNTNSITISDGVIPHNNTHAPGGGDSLSAWYATVEDLTNLSGQISAPVGVVFTTGNQNISGIKNFFSRPTVNGSGIMLSGEIPGTGYLTGYVQSSQTGNFVEKTSTGNFVTSNQTGQYTGVFYPYSANPAAYVQGAVVRPSNTGNFVDILSAQNISGLKNFTTLPTVSGSPVLNSSLTQTVSGVKIFNKNVSFVDSSQIQISGKLNNNYTDDVIGIAFIDPLYEATGLAIYGGGSDLGGTISGNPEGFVSINAGTVYLSGLFGVRVRNSNFIGDGGAVFQSGVSGNNLVYNTTNQTISGVKNFASRPTVNGTGVLLSGEASAGNTGYLTGYAPIADLITGISVTGSTTKTINLHKYNGSTLSASFTDQQGSGGSTQDLYIYSGSFNTGNGNLTLNRTGDTGVIVIPLDGRYVTGSVVRSSETGSFVTNNQTGGFYPANNPSGYITGVDLSSYATTSFVTGASGHLQGQINTLTGLATGYVTLGGSLGTPSSGTLTNCDGNATNLTAGQATAALGLKSASTIVSISSATAPTSGQVMTAISSTGAIWQTPVGGGGSSVSNTKLLAFVQDGTHKTSSTVIPYDDTIPQSNEGAAYPELDLTVTPTNASSTLKIDVSLQISASVVFFAVALFRDSGTDAICTRNVVTSGYTHLFNFTFYVAAGSTSATTFKIRYGPALAGNVYINNDPTVGDYGGTFSSSMCITEIIP